MWLDHSHNIQFKVCRVMIFFKFPDIHLSEYLLELDAGLSNVHVAVSVCAHV